MKKTILFSVMVLLAVAAFASGNKEAAGLPDFVLNPPVAEDAVYGVGFANQARQDQSISVAKTRARADIAKQLEVQIQSAMTDYFQEAGMAENSQTIQFVESITREITDKKLNNTTVVKIAPMEDGGIWVLISYSKAAAVAALEETANTFVRNDEAAYSEFKAREAAAMLDNLLNTAPTTSTPVQE